MTELLRRYTNVLSLMDMLHHKRLTLLSPSRWYDQNDSYGLDLYRKRRGPGSVYALCLTEAAETGHHWQLFAGHSHGACVVFQRDGLLALFNKHNDLLHGSVQYLNLTQVRAMRPIDTNTLPFLKRETFKDEREYRVVAWEDEMFSTETYHVPFQLDLIERVILGPAMPDELARTIKDVACAQEGCSDIPFTISRLTNNESWRKAILEGADVQTLK